MMARPWHCRSAVLLIALMLPGCGETFYDVSGSVTLDGKPFADGSVTLVPKAGGPPAFGSTDAAGKFTLQSGNRGGVRAGEYTVVLAKLTGPKLDPKDDEGRGIRGDAMPESAVPAKFARAETSDLTLTVPSASGTYSVAASGK
jgi:hypothetical protein